MKPPGSCKKKSGQKSRNNFVGIFVQTMKPKGHFEINRPLVLNTLYSDLWYYISVSLHCAFTWERKIGANQSKAEHVKHTMHRERLILVFTRFRLKFGKKRMENGHSIFKRKQSFLHISFIGLVLNF